MREKPKFGYFVRCARSAMIQNHSKKGRLFCLVGMARLRPAEFVIFHISKFTADPSA